MKRALEKEIVILSVMFMVLLNVAFADPHEITIPMHLIKQGKFIGTVVAKEEQARLLLIVALHGLPPGQHGFHVHEHANCGNDGLDAGGHLDPYKANQHLGPYSTNGHLGDLPVLVVNQAGEAKRSIMVPRLMLDAIKGRSLIIHENSDNYSDTPKPSGGGGPPIACGVIAPTEEE